MGKRVIHGEAMWGSAKLAGLPEWAIAEYAWLYPAADANGSFEITTPRVLWAQVYAIRPSFTFDQFKELLALYQRGGLLFTWEQGGKRYAHWTGSEKPGRLPAKSQRSKYGEPIAPPVPEDGLAGYLAEHGMEPQKQMELVHSTQRVPERQKGIGVGLGVGIGEGIGVGEGAATPQPAPPPGQIFFDGKHLKISAEQHRNMCAHFAGVLSEAMVIACYGANDLWQDANPARRKRNGYAAMLNWLKIEVESRQKQHGAARIGATPEVGNGQIARKLTEQWQAYRAAGGPLNWDQWNDQRIREKNRSAERKSA